MIIRKAFRYRLYPNQEQKRMLAVQFGHARFVWNWGLNVRKSTYLSTGKWVSYYDLKRQMTALKHQPNTEWLKDADSQVLQAKIEDLDRAYKNFFEKRAKYPRYKSKKSKQSIRYPQRFKFKDGRIYLPKVGWVKFVQHRPLEGTPKSVTVSKTKSGEYYASVMCEIEHPVQPNGKPPVGIDLGLSHFVTLSTGEKIEHPAYLRKAEKRLRRLQRRLSRRRKGSSGWEKARTLLARQHEHVARQRADFLHKLSSRLVADHGAIAIEDLNVSGMVRNHRLAKSISDSGWSMFVRFCEYKSDWYGAEVVKVDRFFPSSKTCNVCWHVLVSLPLSVRAWKCPACGTNHDRDINAAINILNETRVGVTRSHAGGESVRPDAQAVLVETGSPSASSGG